MYMYNILCTQLTFFLLAVSYSFPVFLRSFLLLFCHLSTALVRFLLGVDESLIPADDVASLVALSADGAVCPEVEPVQVMNDREGLVETPEVEGEHWNCPSNGCATDPVDDLNAAAERVNREATGRVSVTDALPCKVERLSTGLTQGEELLEEHKPVEKLESEQSAMFTSMTRDRSDVIRACYFTLPHGQTQ